MILAIAVLCELVSRATSLRVALLDRLGIRPWPILIGLNWIATAFTFQAAMPAWLGWIAVVLLSLYLAVFPALAAGLAWRFGQANRLALALALAGSWAITEWLRATMFTGFAWNPIGVMLVDTAVARGLGDDRHLRPFGAGRTGWRGPVARGSRLLEVGARRLPQCWR